MGRIALLLSCLLFAGVASAADATVRIGGDVRISEALEGSLAAAGGQITIDAPVAGEASLAGGSITVRGAVKGDLRAAGGEVTINGPVGGDASIAAGTLALGPEARITGNLSFHGGELRRDPAAQVMGIVTQNIAHRIHREHDPLYRYTRGWFWTAGLVALAALIALALPGPSDRMAQELREHPGFTTLAGFIAITTIPVAAVLALITIIGIPLGLLAMAGYAALLLVGYVWLAVVVGRLVLDRVKPETAALTAWRVSAAVLAMLTLALLARLPFIGGLIGFGALIVGVGMIVAAVMHHRRAPQAA